MSFANLRVSQKILCLVALMLAMTGLVAGIGITGMNSIGSAVIAMDAADRNAFNGLQVSRDLAVLNRAEYWLVTNPSRENLATAERLLGELRPRVEDTLAEFAKTEDAEKRQLARPIE